MDLFRQASMRSSRAALTATTRCNVVRLAQYQQCPHFTSTPSVRNIHTTPLRRAKYERFGLPGIPPNPNLGGGGRGNPRGPGGNPLFNALRRRLGDRGLLLWGVGLGGGGTYYVLHLERVPETGRLRFIDVSEESERAMGLKTQQETLAEYQHALLSPSHPTTKRVRDIATRIVEGNMLGHMKEGHSWKQLPNISLGSIFGTEDQQEEILGDERTKFNAAGNKDVEWEVYVIKDDATKNAFVLPGGKIFVFTGILPVCKNDDGLASVMGHEIAHQVARHGAERMSSMKVLFVLATLLEALGLDIGISRVLLTFLLQLPNSRKSESEADHIGLHLMARACYNPRESTKVWERMSESEKSGGSGIANIDFMSTHPANSRRIKQLEQWMPEALEKRAATHCGDTTDQFWSASQEGEARPFQLPAVFMAVEEPAATPIFIERGAYLLYWISASCSVLAISLLFHINHYLVLAGVIVPVIAWFVIANWVGWQFYWHSNR